MDSIWVGDKRKERERVGEEANVGEEGLEASRVLEASLGEDLGPEDEHAVDVALQGIGGEEDATREGREI